MRVTTRSKNMSDTDKKKFTDYLEEKLQRFRPFIESHYPDVDTVKVDCRIQRHERHNAYEFEFVVDAPKGAKFVAKEVKHTITEAMDKSTDKLEQQMTKHFKKLTRA